MLTVDQRRRLSAPAVSGLRAIGYRPGLIQTDYEFVDLFAHKDSTSSIDFAAFGQTPFDYRSACIGIRMVPTPVSDPSEIWDLRSLGAPHLVVVSPATTQHWVIRERDAVRTDTYPTTELERRIAAKAKEWNPSVILRAKSGFAHPDPEQIDLIDVGLLPALEAEAGQKIDRMVSRVLHAVEKASERESVQFDARVVFNVLFRFLAAKLLRDRDLGTDPEIDFSNPTETLRAVDNHYHRRHRNPPNKLSNQVLQVIASEIAHSFSFRNISVDTLTYVYENTFVSPASRKALGIHSTPSYVADYVLSQIPIEELPRDQWRFLDPTCGHGIFLIAAMRRMRHLLPADWGSQRRHQFFVEHLRGVDIEPFSIEVARLCLMLADFPEPNGWELKCSDVFAKNVLETAVKETRILVGNPPFEILNKKGPQKPAPAELLERALPLVQPGGFLGIVLPKSFQDGNDYIKQRAMLLKQYDLISLTSLPDRIFIHSDAETVVLVAKRKTSDAENISVAYREVKDKDRIGFETRQKVSWSDTVPQQYFAEPNFPLVVPALRTLWEHLKENRPLSDIADIRKGVEYDTTSIDQKYDNAIFDVRKPGTKPGVHKSTEGFTQFVLFKQQYFSMDSKLQRREAWSYPWDQPKAIAPAARLSRGPWRIAAIVDRKGLLASRLHYAFWSKEPDLPVEVIAAILNSPMGAAYAYAHGTQKTVTKRTYETIPIPELSELKKASAQLQSLVSQYTQSLHDIPRNDLLSHRLLMAIDALILRLYRLPPRLERQLLDMFWGAPRRVPFEFSGYVPPTDQSWIPLWMRLTPEYEQSSVDALWQRLPTSISSASLEMLKQIGRDTDE